MLLADRLRERMEVLGLSQADLVAKSGLSSSYVSDLVNGRRGRRIGRDAAARLKRALRVGEHFFDPECPPMRERMSGRDGTPRAEV